jgi:hypothetical protein
VDLNEPSSNRRRAGDTAIGRHAFDHSIARALTIGKVIGHQSPGSQGFYTKYLSTTLLYCSAIEVSLKMTASIPASKKTVSPSSAFPVWAEMIV